MPYNVAFDIGHKPRGKIDENLTELRDFLNSNDFTCYNFLEIPITQNALKPFDILVFVCPDFSKISSLEINEISNWVKEDGGGLLLLSHAGGDRGRNSNLSELSQTFGISFENDQVLDETYNLGMENMPIITSFIPPHPVTNKIGSLCYRSGCSLTVLGNAFAIASSNDTSDPFSTPLICVSEPENGRVCAIGSYEMLRDRVGGGFSFDEHPNLSYNIFTWLISDYRIDLREKGGIPKIITQESYDTPSSPEYNAFVSDTAITPQQEVSVDRGIKISTESELYQLLLTFQNQISELKSSIDRLIEMVTPNENQINNTNDMIENSEYSSDFMSSELSEVDEQISTSPPDTPRDILDELSAPENTVLTDLPPKPPELESKAKEEEQETIQNERPSISPFKSRSAKKVNTEDLVAEKESLESKLNSVQNLLDFIEKKHKSGDLDDKTFKKRENKLKSDLKKTQQKINELDKLLQ